MFGAPEKIVDLALRAMLEADGRPGNPRSLIETAFDIQDAYYIEQDKRNELYEEAKRQTRKTAEAAKEASVKNYACLALWRSGKFLITRRKGGGRWSLLQRPGPDGPLTDVTLGRLEAYQDSIPETLELEVTGACPSKNFTLKIKHGHGHDEVNERYLVNTVYINNDDEPLIPSHYEGMWVTPDQIQREAAGRFHENYDMFLRYHSRKLADNKPVTPKKKPEEPTVIKPINKFDEVKRLGGLPGERFNPNEIMPPNPRRYTGLAIWRHSRILLVRYTGPTEGSGHLWNLPRVQVNSGKLTDEICNHMDAALRRFTTGLKRHCMNTSEIPNEGLQAIISGEETWIYPITSVEGEPSLHDDWEGKWFTTNNLNTLLGALSGRSVEFHQLVRNWFGPFSNNRPKMPKRQKATA